MARAALLPGGFLLGEAEGEAPFFEPSSEGTGLAADLEDSVGVVADAPESVFVDETGLGEVGDSAAPEHSSKAERRRVEREFSS